MRIVTLFSFVFLPFYCVAQFNRPVPPQLHNFQPIAGIPNQASTLQPTYYQAPGQVKMETTAEDVIHLSKNQMEASALKTKEEIEKLIRENTEQHPYIAKTKFSDTDLALFKNFEDALHHLNDMLEGKAKLSLEDAYFTMESAYGKTHLKRPEYDHIIHESADFIKKWMRENRLDLHDNYMTQYAIQKFMSEPLTIHETVKEKDGKLKIKQEEHQPFGYDYKDNQAFEDRRDMFLTKCLATGFGQCSSMPEVYLVLAEALDVKAYWSLAPLHSFVKYPDNEGHILNYEPTSNWEISDNWYKDNLFISPQAIRNGVYLDTLNKRQIIANCIYDLALEYMAVDETGNDDFVIACLRSGAKYFPKNNNLEALFIYSMYLKSRLREGMTVEKVTRIDELNNHPKLRSIYQEYLSNEAYIVQLGYQDMPTSMYDDLLKEEEFKRKVQTGNRLNTKSKRSLFSN